MINSNDTPTLGKLTEADLDRHLLEKQMVSILDSEFEKKLAAHFPPRRYVRPQLSIVSIEADEKPAETNHEDPHDDDDLSDGVEFSGRLYLYALAAVICIAAFVRAQIAG